MHHNKHLSGRGRQGESERGRPVVTLAGPAHCAMMLLVREGGPHVTHHPQDAPGSPRCGRRPGGVYSASRRRASSNSPIHSIRVTRSRPQRSAFRNTGGPL